MGVVELHDIDLTRLEKYIKGSVPRNFVHWAGQEPYALYAFISKTQPNRSKIADLGTYQGLSALALSANNAVRVYSFDIDLLPNVVEGRSNITFFEMDIFDHKSLLKILACDIILVDLDPHDGVQEQRFYDVLKSRSYKGVTYWDDIHLNPMMQTFWDGIDDPKEDLTDIGHHSGTGKIVF